MALNDLFTYDPLVLSLKNYAVLSGRQFVCRFFNNKRILDF